MGHVRQVSSNQREVKVLERCLKLTAVLYNVKSFRVMASKLLS